MSSQFSRVRVFDILILGQYAAGQLLTPRLRPLPGAVVSRLGVEDTAAIIEIPAVAQHADGSSNVIGELLNADGVALSVDVRKFNYHIMVAGGTGSGKSNLAANLVDQAVKYSKCVIVHDAKPDYGLIDQANTDLRVARIWDRFVPYGLVPHPANNVLHVGFFGHCDPNAVDHVVGFRSCDFNPDMLAGLFFFGSLEQNQYEGLASAAHGLQQQGREDYDLNAILAEVVRRSDPNQPVPPQDRIHELTAQTIR